VLGQGIFGQVFRGVDDARGIRFVVKRINLTSLATASDDPSRLGRKMWEREVAALTRFSNPNIVKLVGFTPPTVDVKNICLVCTLLYSFISCVYCCAPMHSQPTLY
jgi:serine/threonine protein kinase